MHQTTQQQDALKRKKAEDSIFKNKKQEISPANIEEDNPFFFMISTCPFNKDFHRTPNVHNPTALSDSPHEKKSRNYNCYLLKASKSLPTELKLEPSSDETFYWSPNQACSKCWVAVTCLALSFWPKVYRRCPFGQKFTGDVLYLSKSCTFCPLGQTWLEISVKKYHMQYT
ncbi:hypothetical protein Hanom_Chr04g00360331 [Helianthus anomalus]